jgi:hypothetical protein
VQAGNVWPVLEKGKHILDWSFVEYVANAVASEMTLGRALHLCNMDHQTDLASIAQWCGGKTIEYNQWLKIVSVVGNPLFESSAFFENGFPDCTKDWRDNKTRTILNLSPYKRPVEASDLNRWFFASAKESNE